VRTKFTAVLCMGALACRSSTEEITLERTNGVVVERVRYPSDGKTVEALVCRPDDPERHPLLLRNHGGFHGLANERTDGICRALARAGYVVAGSSYRGEDSSQGKVEVCLGEVSDVQRLLTFLKAKPWVDPGRVVALGASHGGCITLELALREPSLRAAVDFFGVGDWAALDVFWHGQLEGTCPGDDQTCRAQRRQLLARLEGATGGSPTEESDAFRARSPLMRLGSVSVPLLFLHGAADVLVPLEQTCRKRSVLEAAGKAVLTWRLDAQLRPVVGPSCGGDSRHDPLPVSWKGVSRALVIYEGQDHGFNGPAALHAWEITQGFLRDHL
jgi:dipeptidyl aminopeptidase/acylaminoacyl peptidase